MEEARELRRMATEARDLAQLLPDARAVAKLHAHAETMERTAFALERGHAAADFDRDLSRIIPPLGAACASQIMWSR